MAPLALLLLLAFPASAEPPQNPCKAWTGSHTRMPYSECGGIPEAALRYAQRCMQRFGDRLASRRHVVFADWTVSQEFTRLYVLEWDQNYPQSSFVLMRGGAAHGTGNGSRDGETPTETRDQWDSYSTPGGCMRVFGSGAAGQMSTAPGMRAYRLDGLEERNACVYARGLYFHEYGGRVATRRSDGASPTALPFGLLDSGNMANGFSNGCVSTSPEDFSFIKDSGVVPARGGILFVSWDGNGGEPVARSARARSCTDPRSGVAMPVVPTPNEYEKAMLENIEAQRGSSSGLPPPSAQPGQPSQPHSVPTSVNDLLQRLDPQ